MKETIFEEITKIINNNLKIWFDDLGSIYQEDIQKSIENISSELLNKYKIIDKKSIITYPVSQLAKSDEPLDSEMPTFYKNSKGELIETNKNQS